MEQLRTARAPHLQHSDQTKSNQTKSNQTSVFETWRKAEIREHAASSSSSARYDISPEKDDDDDDASPMDKRRDSSKSPRDKEDDERADQRETTEAEAKEDDELPQQQQQYESREVSELRLRHSQLQDDVEVLAAHLEKQTNEHEKERVAMRLLQDQLQHANMEMVRELQSFRIENDALRRQNIVLQHQQDELEQKATLASEMQEELLLALKKQQQVEEQLQSANVHIVRERAQVRKILEATQNHCRRLEEELAAAQTLLMQLQSERTALQVAAAAANKSTHNREAEQIKVQDEMISSLRSDLLQMEFEFKTMAVDRDALTEKVSKLQKRLAGDGSGGGCSSVAYEVISLGQVPGSKPLSSKQQKQLQKEQEKKLHIQQQQQQPQKKTIRPIRNHYESENGGFSGVMELPNFVGDREHSSSSLSSSGGSSSSSLTTAPETAGALRRRSSFSQLVSKTVSSAKKKLFVPVSQNKIVLPQ